MHNGEYIPPNLSVQQHIAIFMAIHSKSPFDFKNRGPFTVFYLEKT